MRFARLVFGLLSLLPAQYWPVRRRLTRIPATASR